MTKEELKEQDVRLNKLCFDYQDKDKRIAELEEKISVLLSCKNCPENKGGFICVKEYENKCLAQKIQYIKELQEENAELKEYNKYLRRKRQGGIQKQYNKVAIIKQQDEQLTKANVFIRSLKSLIEDVCDINYLSKDNTRLLVEAEQFLNSEVEK